MLCCLRTHCGVLYSAVLSSLLTVLATSAGEEEEYHDVVPGTQQAGEQILLCLLAANNLTRQYLSNNQSVTRFQLTVVTSQS